MQNQDFSKCKQVYYQKCISEGKTKKVGEEKEI